jgi:acyl-CoA synthetase (AMP-forming)/AMP-acid ligase II
MYPGTYAAEAPDRIAAVMAGTGETLSYGDLERRSVQLAHVLHEAGLRPGDVVALLTENNLRAFEVYWAAMRSGLYITAVNWHLKPDEIAYIVNDSGATALVVSAELTATAAAITGLTSGTVYNCTVAATNPAGTGPASAPVAVTPSMVACPAIVGDVSMTNFVPVPVCEATAVALPTLVIGPVRLALTVAVPVVFPVPPATIGKTIVTSVESDRTKRRGSYTMT